MTTTKRLYTAKRLYFTCPIKALYMMKEFRVKFILEDEEKLRSFLGVGLSEEKEIFEEKLRIKSKYFIAKESERIFKPEEGDIGLLEEYYIVERKHSGSMNFDHNYKWFKGKEEVCTTNKVEITMRDNTQFFMPEVENEN